LDNCVMLHGLSRVAYLEAESGHLTKELWNGCFSLLAKYHTATHNDDDSHEEEVFDYNIDPDDLIAEEEPCEIVESEVYSALPDDVHCTLRAAVLVIAEGAPDDHAQLEDMAGPDLWDLLMADRAEAEVLAVDEHI